MGLFDTKENTVTQEPLMPGWQLETGQQLSNWIQKYLAQYTPGQAYTGKRTAAMTPFETTGLGILDKYLAAPNTGDLFGQAQQQVSDTLGGKYADPAQSPFIKAAMNLSKMNLTDTINQERASRGARGTYYTTEGINAEGRLAEKSQANLDAIIGQFIQNERQNMLGAVPQATALDQYANVTAPLQKVTASQTLGSLQRTIEQADLEASYQDFIRQRAEQTGLPGAAQSMYNTNVPYGIKSLTTESPSTFMSMLGEASPIFGSYNTHEYGYDTNQSSLSSTMQILQKILQSGGTATG